MSARCARHRWIGNSGQSAAIERFAATMIVDVHLPTSDRRTVIQPRYTQPEKELKMFIERLKLEFPAQLPSRITAAGQLAE